MGISVEDKYLTKSLRKNKRYGSERLLSMFPNKDWNLEARKMLIDTKGTVDQRPDSGRPRTETTTAVIHQVEDLSISPIETVGNNVLWYYKSEPVV